MSELKIQMWIVDDVKPYELNAKIHSEEQVAKIAESIARFGWDQPIVVDKNGVIIKGAWSPSCSHQVRFNRSTCSGPR